MKIAITLNEDRSINETNETNEDAAIKQSKFDGWFLVDSNSFFIESEKHLWTVRESDNALVHIATNQTPEEEKNAIITQLTLQNLSLSNDISDLKKLTKAQTLQSLQDAKDKSEQKEVITGLTKEILELKNNATTETK